MIPTIYPSLRHSSDMYCPVCGDEFREGFTRCPEHDVELVDEPPELEEPVSIWERFIDRERFDDRKVMRVAFIVLLVAAAAYALSGFIAATLLALIQLRDWESFDAVQLFQNVQSAFFLSPVQGRTAGGRRGQSSADATGAPSHLQGRSAAQGGVAILRIGNLQDPQHGTTQGLLRHLPTGPLPDPGDF